jgi:hypothetical protein
MSIDSDYALLADSSYEGIRTGPTNRVLLPQSWVELTQFRVSGSGEQASLLTSGLIAKVFQNTASGAVVISYAGTEFSLSTGLLGLNATNGAPQFTPLSSTQIPSLEGSRALAYPARWELFDVDDHADQEAPWMKMGSPTKASEPSRNAGPRA